VQLVRDAMMDDGRDPGIAGQDLVDAARGRIAFVSGPDVGFEHAADSRQFGADLARDDGRLRTRLPPRFVIGGKEKQLAFNLLAQGAEADIESMTDEVIDT